MKRQQEPLALLRASAAGCKRNAPFLPAEAERPDVSRKKHKLKVVPLLGDGSQKQKLYLLPSLNEGPAALQPWRRITAVTTKRNYRLARVQGPCGLGPEVAV